MRTLHSFFILLCFLLITPLTLEAQQSRNVDYRDIEKQTDQKILVVLEEKVVEFYENDSLKFSAPVRIGKGATPTPLGKGFIYQKRDRALFRYGSGPRAGEVIRYSTCSDGSTSKIDYSEIKALAIYYEDLNIETRIQNRLRLPDVGAIRYSLHSVTCPSTVGKSMSNGCVGLKIPDMLKLYSMVDKGALIEVIKER